MPFKAQHYSMLNMNLSFVVFVETDKPDIDKSPQIAKAASSKGATGKLICRAKGAPNVTFSWSRKDGVPLSSTNSTKYRIHTRMVSITRSCFYCSEINYNKMDLKKEKYNLSCNVQNEWN